MGLTEDGSLPRHRTRASRAPGPRPLPPSSVLAWRRDPSHGWFGARLPGGPRSGLKKAPRLHPGGGGLLREMPPESVPVAFPNDRRCRSVTLDNPLRRWLAPASRDLQRLGIRPGMEVLDLGAGVGYFAPAILRLVGPGGRLVLVDPDPRGLERARAHLGPDPRVRILETSAASVPSLPDQSQDRVLLSLVLCCVRDKEGVLDETWRLLRPGGRALVSYPRLSLGSRHRGLGVTPSVWAGLRARHPWKEVSAPTGWVVRQHLLERTAEELPGPGGRHVSPVPPRPSS